MLNYFLVLIPAAFVLSALHAPAGIVFLAAILSIIPLAEWIRRSTEQLAHRAGPTIGGLINITFGNAAELILALLILRSGNTGVVKATITGSIIGNSLLGLGIAIIAGSKGSSVQTFKREQAGLLSSLLMLSVIALLLPALFDYTERSMRGVHYPQALDENLSLAVAAVLIAVYLANLIYTLLTHRDLFAAEEEEKEEHPVLWPLWRSLTTLVVATAAVALVADLASEVLEEAAGELGLTKFFVGLIILPLAGNAAEYFSAIYFARKRQMTLVMQIAVGSSIQIALFTAPVLVLVSYWMGHPVDLVFANPLELISIAAVAFIVNAIAQDGETTWFEGVLLIAVYVLLAFAFFFVS